jgi:hypothetical protein
VRPDPIPDQCRLGHHGQPQLVVRAPQQAPAHQRVVLVAGPQVVADLPVLRAALVAQVHLAHQVACRDVVDSKVVVAAQRVVAEMLLVLLVGQVGGPRVGGNPSVRSARNSTICRRRPLAAFESPVAMVKSFGCHAARA